MLKKVLTLLFPLPLIKCATLPFDTKQEALASNLVLITFFDYKCEDVKKLIITLKEHESPVLLENLVKIISDPLIKQIQRNVIISSKKIYFVPIPARRQRLEEFGFNQTELFACALSKLISHSKTILLIYRTKEISKQAHKNKSEREQEIFGTMECKEKIPEDISRNSLFIIIDDVVTTGSTMKEAAEVLFAAGAQQVLLVSLARA